MGVNHVKLSNGEKIIDLREDTVTPDTLAKGITAHDKSGNPITGTFEGFASGAVRYDVSQELTDGEKSTARQNIGATDGRVVEETVFPVSSKNGGCGIKAEAEGHYIDFVKVTESVYAPNDLIGKTITDSEGMSTVIQADEIEELTDNGSFIGTIFCVIAPGDEGLEVQYFENVKYVFPESGTYFMHMGDGGFALFFEIDIEGVIRRTATATDFNTVRYDMPQELTDAQKAQARENIGIGQKDYVSPIVRIESISGGHRVTIIDVNGTNSFDVLDGKKGDKGDAFTYEDFTPEQLEALKPVVGKDYFTDTDKAEMVNAVITALPTWQGGSY